MQSSSLIVFFFNDTATTEIYTLSLHDALPISGDWPARRRCAFEDRRSSRAASAQYVARQFGIHFPRPGVDARSEEHTSELQSRPHLVCRLLLENKEQTEL